MLKTRPHQPSEIDLALTTAIVMEVGQHLLEGCFFVKKLGGLIATLFVFSFWLQQQHYFGGGFVGGICLAVALHRLSSAVVVGGNSVFILGWCVVV